MAIKPEIWTKAKVIFEGGELPQQIADKRRELYQC